MKTNMTYKFRLSRKDVQSGLKQHMDELAEQRRLSEEIKTAITLLAQLQKGNTALLDELFPNVCAPKQTPPPDNSGMEDRIADKVANRLKGQLQSLPSQQIPDIRENGFPLMSPAMKSAAPVAHIKSAAAPSADAIADNFMASMGF